MKLLLTGATGFIGRNLLSSLSGDDLELIIIKRKSTDLEEIKTRFSKLTYIDYEDLEKSNKLPYIPDIDFAIHLATCYGRQNEADKILKSVNYSLGKKILEIAIKSKCKLFLNLDTALPCSANSYAYYKSMFKKEGVLISEKEEINFINIILENVYGPGDLQSKLIPSLISACRKRKSEIKLSQGSQKRDFIFIDDVSSAIITLLNCLKYSPEKKSIDIEIGSSAAYSIKEVCELIKEIMQSEIELKFGEKKDIFEEELRSADSTYLNSLGWKPMISLQEGLERVISS